MRWLTLSTTLLVATLIALPSQAQSLREMRLQETLEDIAEQSSIGTPRPLNDDIVDEGFSARDGHLINYLSVNEAYAAQLQSEPLVVRSQLQASVCSNQQFRRLMDMGATLTYHFVLTDTTQPVLTHSFVSEHCQSF
ncbi:PA3611 family quorum-sensing-regulated virulence factor [Halopseudomonas salina]|uniref:Quorum-sensing-regulated virulence factor n=1 Tax=Halopseudomonas salina TaxID=1323744 RepID=A0ABQ1NVG0_9GAMM|nr:PA3611 family quorum-sensing-regulated virulence factor [Halopseudomonas salina]GGC85976.1 hypothetical protein GCM10007418_02170 [Halopseudomonas salina]